MPAKNRLILLIASLVGLIIALASTAPALAQSYGPDLTTTGNAIDCGHNGTSVAAGAFADDGSTTQWVSSQSNPNVSGAACVGQDFGSGTAYEIRQIGIRQSTTASQEITSIIIQSSSNGSGWNNIQTTTISADGTLHYYAVVSSAPYRYWRLLANANPSGTFWFVWEAEMATLLSVPTSTPEPSTTPTITPTASTTPTPTVTSTPDYFSLGTLSTVGYPIAVKPVGTFGDIAIAGVGMGIMGLLFAGIVLFIIFSRKQATP